MLYVRLFKLGEQGFLLEFLYFLRSLSLMTLPEGYAKPMLSCSSTTSLNLLQSEVSQAFGMDLLTSDHQMKRHIQAR